MKKKKRNIYKAKGYVHFDKKKFKYWNYTKNIENSEWVKQHAFYPFIYYKDEQKKYNGNEIKTKTRDIRYSSHIDRYIYQYYNDKFCKKYNKFAKTSGINNVSIAYRNNLQKNNIHFAKDVFRFIHHMEECFIIVSDFKDFFPSLEHRYLKNMLKKVLGVSSLPEDYYKVFKSISHYSYIEYNDILKALGTTHKDLKKLNKDRFFEIEEFRKFKKEYIHINKNKYGIVQGSSISAILSNIYMIEFDISLNNLISSNKGLYRRYSDDIIIVLPNTKQNKQLYKKVMINVEKIPNLKLSDNKTKCFVKINEEIKELEKENLQILKNNTMIEYLGFAYNGKKVTIREKAVAKFYRKMYARIRTINKYAKIRNINLGRKSLYQQYSHIGKKTKDVKKGNFLTYVDRAKIQFGELGDFDRQVKNSWKNMNKRLYKVNKKSK